jgi:hypothetical protein
MLFLKLQLRELELLADPTNTIEARRRFASGIENWKYSWKAARARRPPPQYDGAESLASYDDGWEEGSSTSNSVTSSKLARRKLMISRDPDRHVSSRSNPHHHHHHNQAPDHVPSSVTGNGSAVYPETNADLPDAESAGEAQTPTRKTKTPLQELWDGLAEFAGVKNPDQEDDDLEEDDA